MRVAQLPSKNLKPWIQCQEPEVVLYWASSAGGGRERRGEGEGWEKGAVKGSQSKIRVSFAFMIYQVIGRGETHSQERTKKLNKLKTEDNSETLIKRSV